MDRDSAAARIQQIEALQDDILAQLAELERRTESALAEAAPIVALPLMRGAALPADATADAALR